MDPEALLSTLFSQLMIDEAWSVRRAGPPAQLEWWPHAFAQRITAEPSPDGKGCRVSAETDVLALHGPLGDEQRRALVSLMRHPPLAGFVAKEDRVVLRSSVYVDDESAAGLLPYLGVAALLAATYAHLGTPSLSQETGLHPFLSDHPDSGPRAEPDDLLNLAGARILPDGDEPSRFRAPEEIRATAQELLELGASRAVGSELGLDARFPEDGSLLQVRVGEPHPELGNGLFVRLFLKTPAGHSPGTLLPIALALNEGEMKEADLQTSALGSWTLEQSEPETELPVRAAPPRLAHVTFLPNYLHAKGALRSVVLDAYERSAWSVHALSHLIGSLE